jgi:olfactory receptor
MLIDFMSKKKVISFLGCVVQMFLAVTFGTTECFLLAAMVYHPYVASTTLFSIQWACHPGPVWHLSYVGGTLNAIVYTVATFNTFFCESDEITHFFCDIPPLLAISCSDTHVNQILLFIFMSSIEIVRILTVLISYGFILLAILRIHSAEGRQKFSLCVVLT